MKLIEFLKKYTKINNEFIDDFFGLYDEKDKFNFCIDIDIISKWMNTRKSDLKETLINSYTQKIDYIITINKDNKKSGPNPEIILLTPKCFKMLTMQSKTKKSKIVREFYYELENVIDQYKNYIIEGLEDKIEKLENNQKPKINPKKGVIYIIQTSDGIGHYKIGKSSNLKKRLQSYNQDKKDDIIPLYIYETDDINTIEKCIKIFAKKYQYRKYKEVYKTDLNMLKQIINQCSEVNEKMILIDKNKPKKIQKIKNDQNIKIDNYSNYYIAVYDK